MGGKEMKKYLPLGSVVLLKGAEKRLMIAGRLQKGTDMDQLYDYCGYLFPEGMQKPGEMYLFNNEDVGEVHFISMQDADELKMQQFLAKKAEELASEESGDNQGTV